MKEKKERKKETKKTANKSGQLLAFNLQYEPQPRLPPWYRQKRGSYLEAQIDNPTKPIQPSLQSF